MAKPGERDFIPFARPSIGDDVLREVAECLESGWITTGPRVDRFEAALREYLFAPHVLALNSATAGLHLALLALDLEPGDEVITTPLTFVATANTIVQAGGTPVFADIDPLTLNLDVAAVAAAVGPRTRAIMPVHFAGLPVDMAPLEALAGRHGLRVVEDAAHAIGTEYRGKRIGSSGDVQVFSFHPNKNMTTGEGGCVATSDVALAERVARERFHGIERDSLDPLLVKSAAPYDVPLPGFKYNMMDLQAAIGLHQLKALEGFIARRTALAERYREALGGLPGVRLPGTPPWPHRHAWHMFNPVLTGAARLSRSDFIGAMGARGIGVGIHYPAVHLFSYYRERCGTAPGQLPHAEQAGEGIVSLPLFADLTDDQQDRVIAGTRELLQ